LGKRIAALMIFCAFGVGFATGSMVAILRRPESLQRGVKVPQSRSLIKTAPLSIEALEKIEDLKETLRNDPDNLRLWKRLGTLYARSNQLPEAIEAYRHYLNSDPEEPDLRTDLGILLRRWGDFDGAIEEFRKAAQGSLNHTTSRYYLGVALLYDKRDIQGAIRAWEDYLRVEPRGMRADGVRRELKRLKEVAE